MPRIKRNFLTVRRDPPNDDYPTTTAPVDAGYRNREPSAPVRAVDSDSVALLRLLCCLVIALALVRPGCRERRRRRKRIEIPFLGEFFHLFVFCLQAWSREPNPRVNAVSFDFDNAMGGGFGEPPDIRDPEPIVRFPDDQARSFEKGQIERSILRGPL